MGGGNPNLQPVQKKRKKHAPDRQQPEWLFPADDANPALKPHIEPTVAEKAEKQKSIDFLKRRAVGAPVKAAPPIPLLNLIGAFLAEYGFVSTGRLFSTERQGRSRLDGWKDETGGKFEKGAPTLGKIYKEWRKEYDERRLLDMSSSDEDDDAATKREKMLKRKDKLAKEKVEDKDDITSSSGDGSGTSDDSDVEMEDAPLKKKATKLSSSIKNSRCSPSSSNSDSDADDEKNVVPAKAASPKPKVNNLKRKASSNESSSDSDSSSGPSSESEAPKSKKTKVANSDLSSSASSSSEAESSPALKTTKVADIISKSKASSSSEDSSSESSDSDSDSSDSDSDSGSDAEATVQSKAAQIPIPSSDSDSDSQSESEDVSPPDTQKKPTMNSDTSVTLSDGQTSAVSPPLPPLPNLARKTTNAPFSRIPKDTVVDLRLSSNAYVPYDYAQKAHQDLIVTKGKAFTKEKNKKKRGNYSGGQIDIGGKKGIKFED